MQAVVKKKGAYGEIEAVEMEPPVAGPGQVVLRIAAGGVCGTDVSIHKWTEAIAAEYHPAFPLIMGHEFAGEVASVGEGVIGVAPDAPMAVNPHIYCGQCAYCTSGRPVLCETRPVLGCHEDGGWAELVAVPASSLVPLPDGFPLHLGALMEPLSVAVHAVVERVPVTTGDTVLVTGAGPIGLLHLLVARSAGARHVIVSGMGADKARLKLAESLGGIPVNAEEEDPVSVVRRVNPRGADVAYETAGATPALHAAIAALRKGGRVALVGFNSQPSEVDTIQLALAEKELVGVRGYNRATWDISASLLGELVKDVAPLVSHTLPFSEIEEALQLIKDRACVKVLVQPDG